VSTADVDAWMNAYDNPQKAVVQRVREVIMQADPRMSECVKWSAPTFVYKGNLASFFPKSKKHASLMFHVGASIPGTFPSLEGTADTGRTMKFSDLADVAAKADELRAIVAAWIAMKGG
jgi:hypothetical protein